MEMAPASGGNGLIKTRRESIPGGSGAASLLRTVLSGRCPRSPTPRSSCRVYQLQRI